MGEPTPGPWTYQRAKAPIEGAYDFAISAPGAPVFAEAYGRDAKGGYPPVEDNARVLAAAFSMRSALRAIRARIEGRWDDPDLLATGPLSGTIVDIDRFAREALALADGTTTTTSTEITR